MVIVYAVRHQDDRWEAVPVLARNRGQAKRMGAAELDEDFVSVRVRRVDSIAGSDVHQVALVYASQTPRILSDDEARLFGWTFEGDEDE